MSLRAIISDVHSNLVALEAVLADIKSQNVNEIVCLGDICGYGPQPIECINRVREVASWTLRGNHDEAVYSQPMDFGQNALASILWQRSILEPHPNSSARDMDNWNWIRNLPSERREKNVIFVHASPRDPVYEYILREDFDDTGQGPTQKAKDIFAAMDWLCFCGHSHRPGVVAEDFKWWLPGDLENGSCTIKPGFKTIVNIGSVGQPRDGIPTACYCIFNYTPPSETQILAAHSKSHPIKMGGSGTMIQVRDSADKDLEDTRFGEELQQARDTAMLRIPRVTFRRVEYDIAEAQARFKAVPSLPESNWTRLAKGS